MTGETLILLLNNSQLMKEINASPTPVPSGDTTAYTSGMSTADNFIQMISLVFVLIIILVAAYFTTRFVGNLKMGQMKKSNFMVIDTYRISPNKNLQIVKIANRYFVLAIAKDTIEVITELNEAEVMIREFKQEEKQSFKQIFEKLKNRNE